MRIIATSIALCAFMLALPPQASASAIRTDAGFTTNTFAANDDESTQVNVGFDYNFFGVSGSSVHLNNNGNVNFNAGLRTFTPYGITGTTTPMIAPFFADVDTRAKNPVTYGVSTIDGHAAFGIDWLGVTYYDRGTTTNDFQLVLVDRSDTGTGNFDFEFNYGQILWEAGTLSGGDANGLGGTTTAAVGWTNGSDQYFQLNGSLVAGALLDGGPNSLIGHSLNSGVRGRYAFSVRNGVVAPSEVPLPAAAWLFGSGMLGLVGMSRRRRKTLAA